jgi:hypothetical protein
VLALAYNSSYTGGRGGENCGLRPSWAKDETLSHGEREREATTMSRLYYIIMQIPCAKKYKLMSFCLDQKLILDSPYLSHELHFPNKQVVFASKLEMIGLFWNNKFKYMCTNTHIHTLCIHSILIWRLKFYR